MYNQVNIRLHVDLFIKYVSNNVYSDNNHGQPQSISNIFLTFFSSLYFMTTFCGLFSVWYWYHCFFLLGGMKMSGSAGLFNNFLFIFYLVGSPKVGGAGDGKHKKNTATLHDVKKFVIKSKICHDVKKFIMYDIKNMSWHQKVCYNIKNQKTRFHYILFPK